MRKTISGFSLFILMLSFAPTARGGDTVTKLADAVAPALGLQTSTLPNATVNTDQCILGVDQNFQDGFDKDELNAYCSKISLDDIPSDPLGMKACGDTDMELPDLKDDSGKDQFCSMAGKKGSDSEEGLRKDLCELGRDLNCKKRAFKKTDSKIECIEKRLAEMRDYLGKSLTPSLGQILNAAKKRIAEYTDYINERERQGRQLAERAKELNDALASIRTVLDNKFVASQGDDYYRDFLKSQEQEKTRYATETCMQASAGLKCGGSTNMSPYDFIICRSGEVATGKQKAGRLTPMQVAMKESASSGVRDWMEKVLKFEDAVTGPSADGSVQKKSIMDDVSFQRRLNTTQIVFKDVKAASGGVGRAKISSQSIINELQAQLSACKAKVATDPTLKDRLIENEKNAGRQFEGPMTQLADAYKRLMRAATGNVAVDLSMSTCEAGTLQVKRDCVYHLASQLRSAVTGDNESGHTNPYGRLDARALGLRTLPNPHTMFNRPLESEVSFGGQKMTLNFSCRGIEQCIQQYKNYNENFNQIVQQGRAKLQPGSSDMLAFSDAMQQQVSQAGAQLGQISAAISKQWAQIGSEISALGGDPATLESDSGSDDPDDSVESDKSGLPSIGKLLKQAKAQGGMFKVPNEGIADARKGLAKSREKADEKYAKLKTLLSGFDAQVSSCESKSLRKAREDLLAICKEQYPPKEKEGFEKLFDQIVDTQVFEEAKSKFPECAAEKDDVNRESCYRRKIRSDASKNRSSYFADLGTGMSPEEEKNRKLCAETTGTNIKDLEKKIADIKTRTGVGSSSGN